MTRKEQKEEKRNAILMTALTLFVERGYYDTKITDIAAAVPMSTGLLFHYFESKENLLLELVKMGTQGPGSVAYDETIPPDVYLTGFLNSIFTFSKEQPWVFNMFVFMGQVRRVGMPEEARKLALSADAVTPTVKLIKKGQKDGIFHKGDPDTMAKCFWASVQGIMEQMSADKKMKAPDPEWIVSMLK
ncbi:MAG: TetR/AcrR family transcriptional regulator [Lachnospiraceae bacterium]|jgi:AcrR family transcriptional regulator|nr:TetR/AcrR family transcriptional regulator [Lachnospiraceae bacterium]